MHQHSEGVLTARLEKDSPDPGTWVFKLWQGSSSTFVGDYLPPFMPTRDNIRALHKGCAESSMLIRKVEEPNAEAELADMTPFTGIAPDGTQGEFDLSNENYRSELWQILASDWGIELPLPMEFGTHDVVLTHRDGLPCAAAMVHAVSPLIEALMGPIKRKNQHLVKEDGKVFDVLHYELENGSTLVQRYDITNLFGRNLADKSFDFGDSGE